MKALRWSVLALALGGATLTACFSVPKKPGEKDEETSSDDSSDDASDDADAGGTTYAGKWKRANGATFNVEDDGSTVKGELDTSTWTYADGDEEGQPIFASYTFTLKRDGDALKGEGKYAFDGYPDNEYTIKMEVSAPDGGSIKCKVEELAFDDDGGVSERKMVEKSFEFEAAAPAAVAGANVPAAPDMGAIMLNSMKSSKTMYILQLPPEPAKGQWWEHTMGGVTKVKYSIVDERDGKLVVEKEMKAGAAVLVEAWLVDPEVDLSEMPEVGEPMPSNVTQAWIGVKGKKPEDRPVMEAPKRPEPVEVEGTGGEEPETGEETVNMGGRDWEAKWMSTSSFKSWMTVDGNFPLKTEANGTVSLELTGWGDDGAESMLEW